MKTFKLGLFQAFGVELEYMIVDKDTLDVKPVADQLFEDVLGFSGNEIEFPLVSWSNELARHVVEIKTTAPEANFVRLSEGFHSNIHLINEKLSKYNAQLLPGAAHPWMNPMRETVLWQHENSEIYETYNKIFDCRGHGWANLQSTHINLPFATDEEFGRLHAAIRLLLPIIPALTASSPILDGISSGWLDTRLKYYQSNQAKIPSIAAKVIPEAVFTEIGYQKNIFDLIARDIAPYDPNKILEPIWLNSRGAIARFDRGAIEIRIIDIQECPNADLAILALIIGVLKLLVEEKLIPMEKQQSWRTEPLFRLLNETARFGEQAIVEDREYLKIFSLNSASSVRVKDVWAHIFELLIRHNMDGIDHWHHQLDVIMDEGSLSTRILRALNDDPSKDALIHVYRNLGICLQENKMFAS
jgi:glutamate---cysteine ligase / carboxylate-amine ligase